MSGLSQEDVGAAFLAACSAELKALKPGNVHIHASGHGMETAQFEASAQAAAPMIAESHARVGDRILRGVTASLTAAGCNTNLGILLLAAPLAAAAQSSGSGSLRDRLAAVLASLDADDAHAVFEAIRRANPGGLGATPEQDVAAAPTLGLLQAMALAADRDRIARAYATDFEEMFCFGLPTLQRVQCETDDPSLAVTTLHMAYLAQAPDSHIARKFGTETAEAVRAEAEAMGGLWRPAARPGTFADLLAFDASLKARGLNPGTTADFVVGTLFAAAIIDRMGPFGHL
jgi:triphosphoribosyl-dephospho-CoA synthase